MCCRGLAACSTRALVCVPAQKQWWGQGLHATAESQLSRPAILPPALCPRCTPLPPKGCLALSKPLGPDPSRRDAATEMPRLWDAASCVLHATDPCCQARPRSRLLTSGTCISCSMVVRVSAASMLELCRASCHQLSGHSRRKDTRGQASLSSACSPQRSAKLQILRCNSPASQLVCAMRHSTEWAPWQPVLMAADAGMAWRRAAACPPVPAHTTS